MKKQLSPLEKDILQPNFSGGTSFSFKWQGTPEKGVVTATAVQADNCIRKVVEYKNGVKHGTEITRESLDDSLVVAQYDSGKLTQVTYHPSENESYTIFYQNGVPHHSDRFDEVAFKAVQDFSIALQLRLTTRWDGNPQQGSLYIYDNDNLLRISEYLNGERNGKQVSIGLQDNPNEEIIYFENGKQVEVNSSNILKTLANNGHTYGESVNLLDIINPNHNNTELAG